MPEGWSAFRRISKNDEMYYELSHSVNGLSNITAAWLPIPTPSKIQADQSNKVSDQVVVGMDRIKLSLEQKGSLSYVVAEKKLSDFKKIQLSPVVIGQKPGWMITLKTDGVNSHTYFRLRHHFLPYEGGLLVISDSSDSLLSEPQADTTLMPLLAAVHT